MPHTHPVTDNGPHFVINPITREITNESRKIKLMQGDHASEIFTFEVPRYIDGHDMSLCNKIAVHYINIGSSDNSADAHAVTDLSFDDSEDMVIFSWTIKRTATKYAGTLKFLVKFSCIDDDGSITYQWNTDIFKGITVSVGMDNEETIIEENYDLLEQWKNDVLSNISDEFNQLKGDLDELKSTNGIDYKQISQELTKTKTVLNDTSSDGSCYVSGGVIKSNSATGYKKMILPVAELPDIGNLIIPYDGLTNFFICGGELGNWGDTPSLVQTYNPSALKTNGTLPVRHMGWNFTEGNDYAALDCAVMKSRIDSIPAFYFYIENNSNQWFVPFVLQDGIKKTLNWLEITEENIDEGLKSKVNREIPSIDFLFKVPLSFYPRKILCIGDSLTQGHIAGYSPAHFEDGVNYPAYFSRMTGAECNNAGVSGITSQRWYENEFLKYDYTGYDMVFLFLGTNGGLQDTISGANTNDQTGYYCSIIEGIQNASPNTKIVLFGNVEPFYSKVISKIASYYSLPYLDIYGQSYYGIRRRGPSASELVEPTIYHPATNDWVHFSRIGYCVLAQVVYLLLGEKILEMPEYFDGAYD